MALEDSQVTTTTLPGWYDVAQQGIVAKGNQAFTAAPQLGQTTAQGAINTLQGGANPFTQAQGTLGQIASGAANPWITNGAGGVSPNTNTALGGLFQAQQQQLQQTLPNYVAPVEGANIASGQFGSLRGQTAVDKAKADAMSQLNAQQMQAALTNQQTGVSAATGLGNVGQQGISSAMNVGIEQQNAPFRNVGNLASLVGTINAPTTVTSQKNLGTLGKLSAYGALGAGAFKTLNGILGTSGYEGLSRALGIPIAALGSLLNGLTGAGGGGAGSGLTSALNPGLYPLADGGSMYIAEDGTRVITQGNGNVSAFDKDGNNLNPLNTQDSPTNAGEGGNPNLNDQTLINQEGNQTNYTQEQLDQYQNDYNNPVIPPVEQDQASVDTGGGGLDVAYNDNSGGGLDLGGDSIA